MQMWISGKRKSTFSHAREQGARELFWGKTKVEKQGLSTSYSQIVDNLTDGGQLCFQNVDVFRGARCCRSVEK